jgi:hypothetical protein
MTYMRQLSPFAVALAIAVAGCAAPAGKPTTAIATAPVANTRFDGTYQTAIKITGMASSVKGTSWCDTPGQPVVTISSGQFTYAAPHPNVPGNPTIPIPATVAADGSFAGQVTAGMISGQINGSTISGVINGAECIYAISGQKS